MSSADSGEPRPTSAPMAGFPSSIRCFALLTAIGDSLLLNRSVSTAGLADV